LTKSYGRNDAVGGKKAALKERRIFKEEILLLLKLTFLFE